MYLKRDKNIHIRPLLRKISAEVMLHEFSNIIRKGVKPPSHGKSPLGGEGGYPPFPLTFFRSIFGNQPSVKGGEGVPPFSVKFFFR